MDDNKDTACFLPNFCSIEAVFMLVLSVELLVIPAVLVRNTGFGDHFWQDLGLISLYVQWIALVSALVLCAFRDRFSRLRHWLVGLYSFSMILMVTLCVGFVVLWAGFGDEDAQADTRLLFRSLIISAIVSAVLLRYFYIQYQWKRNVESEGKARIQALQARIRPHFLFNSMNTIASLTRIDPLLAERAVEDLSALFRASLQSADESVTLQQELDLVRRYLDVESLRLGDRLRLEWDTPRLPLEAKVPQLLIQPLVENAVYHGIESLEHGGLVRIVGEVQQNEIRICIQNDWDAKAQSKKSSSNRIALDNIQQRLQMLFPGKSGLDIEQGTSLFTVTIWFPLVRQ